jgi:HSP20 family protein
MLRSLKTAFLDLERQLDQIFEELVYRKWAIAAPASWHPALDLLETPAEYIVLIDLPEVPPEEVKVQVSASKLTLAGQRQPQQKAGAVLRQCERQHGTFARTVEFAHPVDPDKVQAEARLGTLCIRLPKKHQAGEPAQVAIVRVASRTVASG